MSPTYSKAKISAFFGSHHDNLLRESIRRDVLIERYDDLRKEMNHIENLLNISEDHFNDDLFVINEVLFEMLESLVPELIKEDHDCDKVHPDKSHTKWEEKEVNEISPVAAKAGSTSDSQDTVGQRSTGSNNKSKAADAVRKQKVADIKARETEAMKLSKDKESIIRAKSLIRTAQMSTKGADNPESKKRARTSLNRARQQMTKIGKKK